MTRSHIEKRFVHELTVRDLTPEQRADLLYTTAAATLAEAGMLPADEIAVGR